MHWGNHTEEIHTDTLESRIVPGIYFVGELLDVDGICGDIICNGHGPADMSQEVK